MGWLFYTMLVVCCISVRANKAPTEAELNDLIQNAPTQAELNDLNQKLEKVESGLDPYPPSNSTDDRLERIEILVNLLLEDVYDVRVDQELLKREILRRLEEIEAKLGGYQPKNQTGWIEFMLGAHFKDFRPIEINTDPQVPEVHKDCRAAYESGWVKSGLYRISPDGKHEMDVVCEQEEHGGGWTVLQRRRDGTVNFHRSWDEYSNGFGNLDGEFWIGNKNINTLTENRKQSLRVELQYEGEGFYHVDYSSFWVDNEGSNFKLHLSGFSGKDDIAGDSLSYNNEQLFSTKNIDNDNDCRSCANVHRGGWWYDNCTEASLNGVYGGQSNNGMFWQSWRGFSNSLVGVRMMVRGEGDEGGKATTTAASQSTTASDLSTTAEPSTTSPATPTTTASNTGVRNCQDIYNTGGTTSGVYSIYPDGKQEVRVFCEQELQGGGWTVFQRRIDGSFDFYLDWAAYKQGFGDPSGEYWVGNDNLYTLTADHDKMMMVELQDGSFTVYPRYSEFWISDENALYQLHATGFSGSTGLGDALAHHGNSMPFSTKDRDHDQNSGSCAQSHKGGWWFGSCSWTTLNAEYGTSNYFWYHWSGHGILSASRMMLKTK